MNEAATYWISTSGGLGSAISAILAYEAKPKLYAFGFPHNNCGGFCVRGGQKQFVTLLLTHPDRYMWHENQMELAMEKIGKTAKPFLRVTLNGTLNYLTLKQFRVMYEGGLLEIDPYDFGGCGCFTSDGTDE